ncbi:MAG: MOSC domain-containing protein [Candidatus Binataceae bacterium]|nr:MOSC domain-containing protein [Candidatus Binataceae bacterium]
MAARQVGTVGSLFRYPVKSMLGEQLPELVIGPGGTIGDRAWAMRELAGGRIVSAKKFPRAFELSAAYPIETAAPIVTLPDGRTVAVDAPEAPELISDALGVGIMMEHATADQQLRASFDPQIVFGDVPLEQMLPTIMKYHAVDSGPDSWALPKGTFFDAGQLHLVASGTLAHLAHLNPDSRFDVRRFRPNILIDTGSEPGHFIEDQWMGGTLLIGPIEITVTMPVIRCVMTTHPQTDLPRDLAILRTAADHHEATVGVYAAINRAGRVRIGDPVMLVN